MTYEKCPFVNQNINSNSQNFIYTRLIKDFADFTHVSHKTYVK